MCSSRRGTSRQWLAREVAGREVVGLLLLQLGDLLAADGLSFPAAGMEVTAAGWIDRAGHVTLKDDTLAA